VRSGRIKVYSDVHGSFSREMRTPCVVFTGHPSLRMGDVVHFIDMWGDDPKNSIIMTDPDFPLNPFYDPYTQLRIRAYFYPIDTRLDKTQISTAILEERSPKLLILSEADALPAKVEDKTTKSVRDLTIRHLNMRILRLNESVQLPFAQTRKRAHVDKKILESLNAQGEVTAEGEPLENGMCPLLGKVSAYDSVIEIEKSRQTSAIARRIGKFDIDKFSNALATRKVKLEVIREPGRDLTRLRVLFYDAEILISEHGTRTRIICAEDEHRKQLLALVEECLDKQ